MGWIIRLIRILHSKDYLFLDTLSRSKNYFYLGILLLALFFVQDVFQIRWQWLQELQRDETYKRWSGLVLAIYVTGQWCLSALRMRDETRASRRMYSIHYRMGALAPLFLYIHSVQLGHAYQLALTSVYFANAFVGLFNQEFWNITSRLFQYYWMIVHVTLSVLVVILMVYHLFIALYYK